MLCGKMIMLEWLNVCPREVLGNYKRQSPAKPQIGSAITLEGTPDAREKAGGMPNQSDRVFGD